MSEQRGDIEAAFDKWRDEVSPFWDKGGEPEAVRLGFEAGWRARGRHDVDVRTLLLEEHDHLVLSIDDIVTSARREERPNTPRERSRVANYVEQVRSIDRWLDGEAKRGPEDGGTHDDE